LLSSGVAARRTGGPKITEAKSTGRQPGGRFGIWRVASALAILRVGATLPTPLYVIYRETFQFSTLTLTLIFSVFVAGSLGALFFLGRLADQIGRRRVMLPAIGLTGIAALLFLIAQDEIMLGAARLLSGLAIGVAAGAGTAWIVELEPDHDRRRATLITVIVTMAGVGAGPLIAGLLADFAPWPLRLPYIFYLGLLVLVAVLAYSGSETVTKPVTELRNLSLRPRIGVPREIRAEFIAPALTAFATFALLGFYTSLVPSLIKNSLGVRSYTVNGAVVFELYVFAIATVLLWRNLESRAAMVRGLALLLPTLGLLVLTREVQSLPVLLCDSALAGVAVAFG
jgi:MFS family permease